MEDLFKYAVIFIGFAVAGAINAVAGGGTVFSFTGLLWGGLPTIYANATNATGLVPGSLGSVVAYRKDLAVVWRTLLVLVIPAILGSIAGALVVLNTAEQTFRRIVPFLVLFAILVFAFKNFFFKVGTDRARTATEQIATRGYIIGCILQFLIAFYAGYFGAGIGILMLTSFSIMGMRHVHRMNAIKQTLAALMNGTAAFVFLSRGQVNIPIAILGAVGSTIGGYLMARLARNVDQNKLRIAIVIAGFVVAGWMFYRFWLM
jgi:hypothetical protein